MFNFEELREQLIGQISSELEWDESSESDSEILTEFQDCQFSHQSSKNKVFEDCIDIDKIFFTDNEDYYLGKDGINIWYKVPFENSNSQGERYNILSQLAGPNENAFEAKTVVECLLLFIDDEILKLVVFHTNSFIAKIRSHYGKKCDCNDTNVDEIKCFIGLLVLIGLFKSKNLNFDELWELSGLGIDAFRLAMSLNRFKFLLRCIQFDDEDSRESRKKIDNLAIIREIFELFANNCQKNYTVDDDVAICELFINFKGQYPVDLYSKDKTSGCGIKIYTLIDTRNFYVSNMRIHVKKQPKGIYRDLDNPKNIVCNFVKKIKGPVQNIVLKTTLNNITIIKDLSNCNVNIIGNVNTNEKQIPLEFENNSSKQTNSYLFGFQENVALMSCCSNTTKKTILISTRPDTININKKTINNLSVINSYDNAVNAVNKLQQMIYDYSVARRTKRYSLSIWFHMINIACVNSFIIYCVNNNTQISRREFLKQLGLSLIQKTVTNRASDKHLTKQLRENAACFSSTPSFCSKAFNKLENKPMRCTVCPRKKDIKVRSFCNQCQLPMCKNHMISLCEKCSSSADKNI